MTTYYSKNDLFRRFGVCKTTFLKKTKDIPPDGTYRKAGKHYDGWSLEVISTVLPLPVFQSNIGLEPKKVDRIDGLVDEKIQLVKALRENLPKDKFESVMISIFGPLAEDEVFWRQ